MLIFYPIFTNTHSFSSQNIKTKVSGQTILWHLFVSILPSGRWNRSDRVIITSKESYVTVMLQRCCYKLSVSLSHSLIFSTADRIWHSQSFNVGTAGAKIFSGPAAEEFGYTIQQGTNHEGKWYELKSSLNDFVHRKKLNFLSESCCQCESLIHDANCLL